MTQEKLAALRARAAEETDPAKRRVFEMAAEVLAKELSGPALDLPAVCHQVVLDHPEEAARLRIPIYDQKLINFLVGRVKRETKGRGDPLDIVTEIVKALGATRP